MKSFVYHIQINIKDKKKSLPFYKDLLTLLGYKTIIEEKWGFGMSNGGTDIWVVGTGIKFKPNRFHRKNTGLNHVAFGVKSKRDVEQVIEKFLKPRKIKPLYDSPREYPEYEKGYFAVFFEDPDRVKLEITYIPGFEGRLKNEKR